MSERRVLVKIDGAGTLEVEPGAVFLRGLQPDFGGIPAVRAIGSIKIEGEALKWMLQACLEALGESGVVLTKKVGGDDHG
jgi:hypothetical protein